MRVRAAEYWPPIVCCTTQDCPLVVKFGLQDEVNLLLLGERHDVHGVERPRHREGVRREVGVERLVVAVPVMHHQTSKLTRLALPVTRRTAAVLASEAVQFRAMPHIGFSAIRSTRE